jgi:hypothetical protein
MPFSAKSATHYEVLEVSPNASQSVIRAAYKSLMQLYHPDKNSGNPAMAQQATLIGNAFDVLSDPEKRKTYDLELERLSSNKNTSTAKSSTAEHGAMTTQQNNQSNTSLVFPPEPLDRTAASSSAMGPIFVIVLALIALVFLLKPGHPEESKAAHQAEPQPTEKMKVEELASLAAAKQEKESLVAESKAARTIPQFAKVIIVKMPPTKDGFNYCDVGSECTHYINIPTIGIIVYEKDSEKIIQHIQKNRDLIVEGIKTELGKHLYTSLTQVDGEETLKKIIRDQMNMTIVGFDNLGTPFISEYTGVEEVLLPDSFSIH